MQPLSSPQAILLIGGLVHFCISALAGYMLFWLRMRDLKQPMTPYAIITHRSTLINGAFLFGLSTAINYTAFIPPIVLGLAIAAITSTMLSDLKNIMNWWKGAHDSMAEDSDTGNRLRGLVNILNTGVVFAMLYGVTRAALGQ